jgi:hypothetical protein
MFAIGLGIFGADPKVNNWKLKVDLQPTLYA